MCLHASRRGSIPIKKPVTFLTVVYELASLDASVHWAGQHGDGGHQYHHLFWV